jgi:hypothetical protein
MMAMATGLLLLRLQLAALCVAAAADDDDDNDNAEVVSSSSVERWGRWEGSWSAPAAVRAGSNPFTNVHLQIEFAHHQSRHTTVAVRGFYDGGGLWRGRFMPPMEGNWSFRTGCAAVAALDGHTGSFQVLPPSPRNHGPVRVGNQTRRFVYSDGTRFHAIGTTVYGLSGGVWGTNVDEPNKTAETLATLAQSPFNKVRMMAFPVSSTAQGGATWLPYEVDEASQMDVSRFNLPFWQRLDRTVESLLELDIQADIILFNLYTPNWPKGLGCLGGPNASTYNLANDQLFLRYIVSRLASYRNVWWSMSNEWNQASCKFTPPNSTVAAAGTPGWWAPNAATPAWNTPIWDELFKTVDTEDPSGHLMGIHNNAYLYNGSRPWITHFSVQHTHNKPMDLWRLYGEKPFVWDEVKYEGDGTSNWGSLSADGQ